MEPENGPLEDETPFEFYHFQVPAVEISGGRTSNLAKNSRIVPFFISDHGTN